MYIYIYDGYLQYIASWSLLIFVWNSQPISRPQLRQNKLHQSCPPVIFHIAMAAVVHLSSDLKMIHRYLPIKKDDFPKPPHGKWSPPALRNLELAMKVATAQKRGSNMPT